MLRLLTGIAPKQLNKESNGELSCDRQARNPLSYRTPQPSTITPQIFPSRVNWTYPWREGYRSTSARERPRPQPGWTPARSGLEKFPYKLLQRRTADVYKPGTSVADPGCISQILDPNFSIPDPGSKGTGFRIQLRI